MNRLAVGGRSRGAVVAAIGDSQRDGGGSGIARRGGPGEVRNSVDTRTDKSGVRRQAIGSKGQRILVRIGGAHREDQRLSNHRDLVAHHRQHRRLVGRSHREDEGRRGGQRRGRAGDIRCRVEGQRVIAAVARHWGDMDRALAVGSIRQGRKAWQTIDHQRQRAAIRIHGLHREIERRAGRHRLIRDRSDDGGGVLLVDVDVHGHGGRGRCARAIAVIGGAKGDRVVARLGEARGPSQEVRRRVIGRARRHSD